MKTHPHPVLLACCRPCWQWRRPHARACGVARMGPAQPCQRDALVAPLRERWNREPDERARMLKRAERWQAMPASQRERARHGMQRWEGMPPEKRAQARALFHAMRRLDETQRNAFLAQWRQMTAQQRIDWVAAHPAPHRKPARPPERDRQE